MNFSNDGILYYRSLNLKYLAALVLVVILAAMVGSQFFYVQNDIDKFITIVIFILITYCGVRLLRSIRLEAQRKKTFQDISNQLAKANDRLRKLDNTKTEFISIASHQLRTPLTSIKGFASLLLENSYGKITPRQKEALDKVYTSNDRLIKLVADLLNISRLESGRMEFKMKPCQIEDICQEVADAFMTRARYSHLYLEYKKPEEKIPQLSIDAAKVQEVLSYVIDNAIKYTLTGGVKITVERKERNHEGGPECVRITVADTGIGIPPNEILHLFSRFSRGKGVASLNSSGIGLGLYVGKQIIEANGGTIWAESEGKDKGSRFIIELPIEQDEELLARWGTEKVQSQNLTAESLMVKRK